MTLRLAHSTTPDSTYAAMVSDLSDRLDEATEGRVQIDEYGGAQLGTETTTLDLYQTGDVDMGIHFSGAMAPAIPEFGFFDSLFLFDSMDHWRSVTTSDEMRDTLQRYLDNNDAAYQVAYVGLSGVRNIYTSDGPIESLDDLDGLKLRAPESPVATDMWHALGASPTALAWGDVYSALETGLVDAAENTPHWFFDANHNEVAKSFSFTEHSYGTTFLLIGKDAVERIPEDLREVFWDTISEAGEAWTDNQLQADEQTVSEFGAAGVTGYEVSDDVRAEMKRVVEPLVQESAADLGVEELYTLIREWQGTESSG